MIIYLYFSGNQKKTFRCSKKTGMKCHSYLHTDLHNNVLKVFNTHTHDPLSDEKIKAEQFRFSLSRKVCLLLSLKKKSNFYVQLL